MERERRNLLPTRLTRSGLRVFAIASAAMLMVSLAGLLTVLRIPAQVKEETPLVKYEQQGTFGYSVILKPSYLFGSLQSEPPPNPKYPTEIVDRIDFTFTYGPLGGTSATGLIDAVLENPGIWQKSVRLASGSTGGGDYAIHFSLDLAYLQNLMDDIQEKIKVTGGSTSLTIKADVTAGGEHFVQTLPIRFSGGLIEVDSNLSLAQFSKTGRFEYRIHLKPPSTGAKSLKYPAQIVESIQFTYDYSPVKPGATSGWIEAVLENPGIWQKSVRLASNTSATGDLTIMFPLDVNYFHNLYTDIDKETKITSPSHDVTIKAYVNNAAGQFVQSLPIKLSTNVIEVGGDLKLADLSGTGKFDYKVQLKPNSVYDTQTLRPPEPETASGTPFGIALGSPPASVTAPVTLKPGDQIFAKLVDSMNMTFQYRLKSDKPIKNRVNDVNIEATLDAPKLWSKSFTLLDIRKTEDFKISFPLDLEHYREVYDAIRTETGTSPESYDLIVSVKVRTVGETSFGRIDETFTQTIKGTLKSGLLEWDKELTKSVSGSINESKIVPNTKRYLGLPVDGAKGLSGVLVVIFSALFLLSMVAYIRSKPLESFNVEDEMLKIKKKYGERIAEATTESAVAFEKISLGSMEDLIKIADELAKPIIHQMSVPQDTAPGQPVHTYRVFEGLIRYEYVLSASRGHEIKDGESGE